MENHLVLKVNPKLTFSVNTQIREQLKWLIGVGQIKPGDMLPPANQLADLLGLNRNTVNLVYNQLQDEGIVELQKGRGTTVLHGLKTDELQRLRQPMHDLVNTTIQEAERVGIPLDEFFTAGLAYILLHNSKASHPLRLLFIECKEHDHIFYRKEIERVTGADAMTVFLEDVSENPGVLTAALEHVNTVVTTLNHADEVKVLLAGFDVKILVIGATTEMSFLLEVAKLEPGSKVGFACLGNAGAQWMSKRVDDAGIRQIEAINVDLNHPEQLEDKLKHSDKVYASAAVFDELKSLAPNKVELYPMVLEKSSETLLKEATAINLSKI
ncbi:GntR family transcriptional regulator [Paenibacillus polysaccharolyticus]|uniref:GntR family transcriptional regulator n=1 Tax=Paenibacillus polysaccharolyticus TaxID=582692 RepID=UPI0020A062E9|nr:GntR family transcriptional regulator [Paenibacillus polysaccharolyticus]MCP1136216.1 GntR family transcriptional regulator [Paenibacillus polysaccharolyticus]